MRSSLYSAAVPACEARLVDWNDVQLFLAVLRAKHLQDAGMRVGVDASTVSRRIAALEKKLHARLFLRTREGLRPTAVATRLRAHAERMEAEAGALERAARADTTQASGLVRVATTDALAQLLVGAGLLSVRERHPDLALEIVGGNRPIDLARGEADLALRLSKLDQPSLRAVCLASMNVALFASPAYVRERGVVRTPAGIAGHDVLLPTGELAALPEARWLASRRSVRVVLRSNSMGALVAAAAAGHGIVPLPTGWGESQGAGALERLLVLEAIPKRKIWLVAHEAADRREAVRVVAQEIRSIAGRIFAR